MKKILHRQFIKSNEQKVADLPQAIRKKISIFNKMLSKLEQMVGDDKKHLLIELYQLDHEIYEDLFLELEDELENNEPVEEEKPKAPASVIDADQSILDKLWAKSIKTGLKRSFLQQNGIKTPLGEWTVHIGKYTLKRVAVFSYKYNMEKPKE